MVDINLVAALVVMVLVIIVTAVVAVRIGLGVAAKFVQSLLASPVIMAAFSSLEKSVPPEVINTILGGLDLGEAVTTNADLKSLLDAIEELIKQSKVTQTMILERGGLTITTPLAGSVTTTSPDAVINISAPKDAPETKAVG